MELVFPLALGMTLADDRGETEAKLIAASLGGDQAAFAALVRRHQSRVFLLAGRYTLLEQTALASFLPLCLDRGVKVVVGGPYNSGILAGGTTYNYRPAPPEIIHRVTKLRAAWLTRCTSITTAGISAQ